MSNFSINNFLKNYLAINGTLPPISLTIQPLSDPRKPGTYLAPFELNRFLSYEFQSSVLVPVESFKFTTVMPDDSNPITTYINEGDIVVLKANFQQVCTGIIDRIEVEFDITQGEKVIISGRNLFGQLEDQDAVSLDAKPFYGDKATPTSMLGTLLQDTRIPGVIFTADAPKQGYIFATEPGESKLQALTRYMEPLNVLAWQDPSGRMKFGRPNMAQAATGKIFMLKQQRAANCTSMRAIYNSTQIPNIIVPIWAGQETVQHRVSPEQIFFNSAPGPQRLRKLGHRLPKCSVMSTPDGSGAQELSETNRIIVGGGNLIQAVGKRDTARQNVRELEIEAVVPGHYNDAGDPFLVDSVYTVSYDRAGIDGLSMYLYEVGYSLDPEAGQKTTLKLCKLGTIVSDIIAP